MEAKHPRILATATWPFPRTSAGHTRRSIGPSPMSSSSISFVSEPEFERVDEALRVWRDFTGRAVEREG